MMTVAAHEYAECLLHWDLSLEHATINPVNRNKQEWYPPISLNILDNPLMYLFEQSLSKQMRLNR